MAILVSKVGLQSVMVTRSCLRHLTSPMRSRFAVLGGQSGLSARLASTATSRNRRARSLVGVVFDIDGVLMRGYNKLPHARDSLLQLIDAKIPFIFLTNGGGELESVKASKLSSVLGIPVHTHQVVLSHTPLRPICEQYANKRVLVLGCRDVVSVGRTYGLNRIVTAKDLCHDEPYRYPFIHYDRRALADRGDPVDAIFILHDPNDWAPELQVTLDVLRGGQPLGSGGVTQRVPIYSSNPDLVFAGLYPVPRLAAGAYTTALKSLWHAVTGTHLTVTQYGKPHKVTYDYARHQLGAWAAHAETSGWYDVAGKQARGMAAAKEGGSWADDAPTATAAAHATGGGAGAGIRHLEQPPPTHHQAHFDAIFMVGDNPKADIKGANDAGAPWRSILVRSGVFAGPPGTNDAANPALHVVDGVKDAVGIALLEAADGSTYTAAASTSLG